MALRRAAGSFSSSLLNKLLPPISSASATRSFSTTSTPVTTHDGENPDADRRRLGLFSADPGTKNVELKIRISKVERRGYHPNELPPHTSRVRLPTTRTIYTVLRSPHIDKKSREQFQMKVRKDLLVIKTDKTELRNKYFWLKRQRIFGAQYEVQVCCKTRLDKEKLKALL